MTRHLTVMRALHFRLYVAVWFLLQFGNSCADTKELMNPRMWLAEDVRKAAKERPCLKALLQARMKQTGGHTIRCADTPYAALIIRDGVQNPCAGSLISPTAALTAAQCRTINAMVLAGNSQYIEDEDFEPPTQFRISKNCIIYDPKNITLHDIMVCLVEKPFMESVYVNKINIIESQLIGKPMCIITGFGFSDHPYTHCLVGRSILQRIPNGWECPSVRTRGPNWVCTNDTKTQAVCPGDLGAASICRVGGKLSLVGVATSIIYGNSQTNTCQSGVVGNVFNQVYPYRQWLKQVVSDLDKPLAPEPQPPWTPDRCRQIEIPECQVQKGGAYQTQVSGSNVMLSLVLLVLKGLAASDMFRTRQTCSADQISFV